MKVSCLKVIPPFVAHTIDIHSSLNPIKWRAQGSVCEKIASQQRVKRVQRLQRRERAPHLRLEGKSAHVFVAQTLCTLPSEYT